MDRKVCMFCSAEKPMSEFYRSDPSCCKSCTKEENADRYKKNKKSILPQQAAYQRRRRREDLDFKIRGNLRRRIREAAKQGKAGSFVKDLGCTAEELRRHLESRFQPGMSWENYGDWHIDHIIPLSSFDLSDRSQFLKACHFTNLQPLWKEDNLAKGKKLNFLLDKRF